MKDGEGGARVGKGATRTVEAYLGALCVIVETIVMSCVKME